MSVWNHLRLRPAPLVAAMMLCAFVVAPAADAGSARGNTLASYGVCSSHGFGQGPEFTGNFTFRGAHFSYLLSDAEGNELESGSTYGDGPVPNNTVLLTVCEDPDGPVRWLLNDWVFEAYYGWSYRDGL